MTVAICNLPSRALSQPLLAGLLLSSLALGFLAFTGRRDPNLHGMVSFVTTAAAITSRMRRGSGWLFLAIVSLVATVCLGFVTRGEEARLGSTWRSRSVRPFSQASSTSTGGGDSGAVAGKEQE